MSLNKGRLARPPATLAEAHAAAQRGGGGTPTPSPAGAAPPSPRAGGPYAAGTQTCRQPHTCRSRLPLTPGPPVGRPKIPKCMHGRDGRVSAGPACMQAAQLPGLSLLPVACAHLGVHGPTPSQAPSSCRAAWSWRARCCIQLGGTWKCRACLKLSNQRGNNRTTIREVTTGQAERCCKTRGGARRRLQTIVGPLPSREFAFCVTTEYGPDSIQMAERDLGMEPARPWLHTSAAWPLHERWHVWHGT